VAGGYTAVESTEKMSQEEPDSGGRENMATGSASTEYGQPIGIEPDLEFIQTISKRTGDYFVKCFQCGTCSATCAISPDSSPFPRKEMAWAGWGMKDRLLTDPDVWLCYQCNDCSTRCPRDARPGDVLGAIRQECVINFAFPRFLGRWVNEPRCIPLLLGIPITLLALALYLKDPIEKALGLTRFAGERIMYSYSSVFPHWLLNSFFILFCVLALIAAIIGVRRYWQALKNSNSVSGIKSGGESFSSCIVSVTKDIFTHKNFSDCTAARPRYWAHLLVFFGFIGLTAVTLWVITAGVNPLIKNTFVYPFGFWSPWKILANLGGLAILGGCGIMIRDRFANVREAGFGNYFDWLLIGTLLTVVFTGFFTEVLHYVRLEPHRHIIYFVHLVFVFAFLVYLPYSKLAHLLYRAVAMIYAEHTGRTVVADVSEPSGEKVKENVN
jgi:quinone-modifying oxidoreductase subunit QmoC